MSILNAITSGAGGVALSGDTSGNLTIQSAGTNVATFTTGGNLTFSVANAGIQFNKSGGLTNTVLNDYEEGSWTPADNSGAGLSLTINNASYTKIGRLVTVFAYLTYPATASGAQASISGLPFALPSNIYGASVLSTNAPIVGYVRANASSSNLYPYAINSTGVYTNTTLGGYYLIFTISYMV